MARILFMPTLAAFAALVFAGNSGQAGDPPQGEVKTPAFHCPVVGLPESKSCCCKGGYCPRRPHKELTVEYRGAKLQFCCGSCVKMFKEDAAKFAVAANQQLVATRQAKQVRCPVSGETTDASIVLEVAGIRVGFASEAARKKVADAAPAERVELVFGTQGFARGFAMAALPRQ